MSKIKTAVITGQHAFDVPGFHELFRSIPDIDFYRRCCMKAVLGS